ncbi:MAG TPA: hypothetical protein VJZ01_09730 [Lachnospiraceae bacterium]|nr:hypothetical protein [Lachnospiraceae bacterium]
MKKNITNKKIKLQVEYLNALGMPVTVTKRVSPDKLPEYLEDRTPVIKEVYGKVYGAC